MKIGWTDFAIINVKNIFDFYANRVNKKVAHKIRTKSLNLLNNSKPIRIPVQLNQI